MTSNRGAGSSIALEARGKDQRVCHVGSCSLIANAADWPLAATHSDAIVQHWQKSGAASPSFFNGRILRLREMAIANAALTARFLETDFISFLYWRETDEPDAGVRDRILTHIAGDPDGELATS